MYSALNKDDYTITAYRDHCHQLLTGDSLESIFSELLGKKTGTVAFSH
jgi:TPP-dependent pyruvate/acetoin dehydrogenase alpha subunit